MKPTFRINRKDFDATLRRYREFSKRSPEVIVNTKAFYIARRATIETAKASKQSIQRFIRLDSGAVIGRIINARRGKRGEKGLYGDAMAEAVALVLAARLRSRAFLASGWLPAIKALEPYAEKRGAPRQDRVSKEFGQAKGSGKPARGAGWIAKAIIINMAAARWDRGGQAKHGQVALQKAFDFEVKSMLAYIERKMREAGEKAGVKHV